MLEIKVTPYSRGDKSKKYCKENIAHLIEQEMSKNINLFTNSDKPQYFSKTTGIGLTYSALVEKPKAPFTKRVIIAPYATMVEARHVSKSEYKQGISFLYEKEHKIGKNDWCVVCTIDKFESMLKSNATFCDRECSIIVDEVWDIITGGTYRSICDIANCFNGISPVAFVAAHSGDVYEPTYNITGLEENQAEVEYTYKTDGKNYFGNWLRDLACVNDTVVLCNSFKLLERIALRCIELKKPFCIKAGASVSLKFKMSQEINESEYLTNEYGNYDLALCTSAGACSWDYAPNKENPSRGTVVVFQTKNLLQVVQIQQAIGRFRSAEHVVVILNVNGIRDKNTNLTRENLREAKSHFELKGQLPSKFITKCKRALKVEPDGKGNFNLIENKMLIKYARLIGSKYDIQIDDMFTIDDMRYVPCKMEFDKRDNNKRGTISVLGTETYFPEDLSFDEYKDAGVWDVSGVGCNINQNIKIATLHKKYPEEEPLALRDMDEQCVEVSLEQFEPIKESLKSRYKSSSKVVQKILRLFDKPKDTKAISEHMNLDEFKTLVCTEDDLQIVLEQLTDSRHEKYIAGVQCNNLREARAHPEIEVPEHVRSYEALLVYLKKESSKYSEMPRVVEYLYGITQQEYEEEVQPYFRDRFLYDDFDKKVIEVIRFLYGYGKSTVAGHRSYNILTRIGNDRVCDIIEYGKLPFAHIDLQSSVISNLCIPLGGINKISRGKSLYHAHLDYRRHSKRLNCTLMLNNREGANWMKQSHCSLDKWLKDNNKKVAGTKLVKREAIDLWHTFNDLADRENVTPYLLYTYIEKLIVKRTARALKKMYGDIFFRRLHDCMFFSVTSPLKIYVVALMKSFSAYNIKDNSDTLGVIKSESSVNLEECLDEFNIIIEDKDSNLYYKRSLYSSFEYLNGRVIERDVNFNSCILKKFLKEWGTSA